MNSDLHDLLDHPLPGEPAHRPAARVVTDARRGLRRRRLAATGLVSAAAVTVTGLALGLGGGPGATATDATDSAPLAARPTASPAAPEAEAWPPSDAAVRERYPAAAALADCLTAAGFPSELGVDGALAFEGTTARADAYEVALDGCQAGQPSGPPDMAAWTPAQWHSLYVQELGAAECLRSHDVDVPSAPPFDRYVARYPTPRAWTAYSFVPSSSETAWAHLTWECPQPSLDG